MVPAIKKENTFPHLLVYLFQVYLNTYAFSVILFCELWAKVDMWTTLVPIISTSSIFVRALHCVNVHKYQGSINNAMRLMFLQTKATFLLATLMTTDALENRPVITNSTQCEMMKVTTRRASRWLIPAMCAVGTHVLVLPECWTPCYRSVYSRN